MKDTGIGIADDQQDSIFEAFKQSEGGFQRHYGGLGIGLTICQKLLTNLGGELRLHSKLGQGTQFDILIPTLIGKKVSEVEIDRVSSDLPILIVEDNVVNQRVMTKMLDRLGYNSLLANHGVEALELLSKEQISLILMDLQMPVMDGFSCTEAIRKRDDKNKDITIIAVTANVLDEDRTHCFDIGMDDFIKKPLRIDTLQERLSHYIA